MKISFPPLWINTKAPGMGSQIGRVVSAVHHEDDDHDGADNNKVVAR